MGPVSNTAFYQQLIVTDVAGGSAEGEPLNEALDPFSPPPAAQDHPATGVLLTFEQGWFQKGLALGELRMSLCLAPGEVTRLAIVDWRRQTQVKDEQRRDDVESLGSISSADISAVSVQEAVASHAASSTTATTASASQAEAGGHAGFLLWGGSASGSTTNRQGLVASSSTGSRTVGLSAVKDIQQTTQQVAQATRTARATQIQEVVESEQQSTSTRVVANYNHAHALTMQYFECLQIFALETKVIQADRCIFVPLVPFDFDEAGMNEFSEATVELLREVLRDLGATELEQRVGDYRTEAPRVQAAVQAQRERSATLRQEIATNQATMAMYRRSLRDKVRELAQVDAMLKTLGANPDADPGVVAQYRDNRTEVLVRRDHVQAELDALESTTPDSEAELKLVDKELDVLQARLDLYTRLHGILQQQRDVLNQQMWMRIKPPVWRRLLADRTFPYGEYEGQEIGGLIDPTPIGYFGSMVAFRWDFPASRRDQAEAFERSFTRRTTRHSQVVLPSEGVFAEAVLGQSNSAEKIDITRFWNWQDSPIPILPPQMGEVSTASRARDVAVAPPLDFSEALVALKDQKLLVEEADEAAVLAALQSAAPPDSTSQLSGAVAAAMSAGEAASAGAGRAGERSLEASRNVQDFVVGLANSEVARIGASALAARSGGLSAVGGLLSAAGKGITLGQDEPAP
ncbi:MAG: hypothetical protein ACK5MT_10730 [Actinomycetales bacterium]